MATPAREGAAPVSLLMTEASTGMLADLPVASSSAWALALRQVSGELAKLQQGQKELKTLQQGKEELKTLQQGQEELKTLQRGQAVEHAKTQQGLAEEKTELAELRSGASQASHIATLQLQLAEKDAMLVEDHAAHTATIAALAAKSAELETTHAELQTARVRWSTPFVKGLLFHEECKLWLNPLGLKLEGTHLTGNSGDAVITLPCSPPMRILIDFKNCEKLDNSPAYMSTVVMNAAVVDAWQKEAGKAETIDAVMLMYPDGTILPSDWTKDPRWLRKLNASKKTGEFRVDRMVVCSRTTFMLLLAQLLQSMPGVAPGVGIDPHLHDYAQRVSTSASFFSKSVAFKNLLKSSFEFAKGSSDFNDMDKNLLKLTSFMNAQEAEIRAAQVAYSSTNRSMIDATHAAALNAPAPSMKDKRNKKYWDSVGEEAAALYANQTTDRDFGMGTRTRVPVVCRAKGGDAQALPG